MQSIMFLNSDITIDVRRHICSVCRALCFKIQISECILSSEQHAEYYVPNTDITIGIRRHITVQYAVYAEHYAL
jgi:hypothetical protein